MQASINRKSQSLVEKLKESTALLGKDDRIRYPGWFRAEVVNALKEGSSFTEVSRVTKVADMTLRNWVKTTRTETKFRQLQLVEQTPPSAGGDAKFDVSIGSAINVAFPSDMSASRIADVLAELARRLP